MRRKRIVVAGPQGGGRTGTRDPLSEQVRRTLRASALSYAEAARKAGIHKSAISRFLSGQRGLSMAALDRLAAVLGLEVRAAPSRRLKS